MEKELWYQHKRKKKKNQWMEKKNIFQTEFEEDQ